MNQPLARPSRYFFGTRLLPCPYLEGRTERKVVTELAGPDAEEAYERLSRAGFRRSYELAYRPACPGCDACVPVRIVVREFEAARSQRRVLRENADVTAADLEAVATAEQYRLFSLYQRTRHGGGEMSAMSFEEYRAMIERSPVTSRAVEFRNPDGALAGVMLMDRLRDALSAVYSFFDPGGRSMGTFMILWMVRRAHELGLSFVYLGYWIEGLEKMAYKARFRPLEALRDDGWKVLDSRSADGFRS